MIKPRSPIDFQWHNSISRLLVFASTSGIGLPGKQSGLDANRRDVQLATGPPPFGRHHRHRKQFTPSVPVRRHGRYAAHKQGHFFSRQSSIGKDIIAAKYVYLAMQIIVLF